MLARVLRSARLDQSPLPPWVLAGREPLEPLEPFAQDGTKG